MRCIMRIDTEYVQRRTIERKGVGKAQKEYLPRVLLVDDEVSLIRPLNMIFHELNCNTLLAFDGQAFVERALRDKFDLIILDWSMPDLTGGEALNKIQALLSVKKHSQIKNFCIPVVIYSAMSLEKLSLPNCRNFQFVDHWKKPIKYRDLVTKTLRVMSELNIKN